MPSHLLAIDQGTTSTRAFLFDAALVAGRLRAARVSADLSAARLGRARSAGDLDHVGRDRARRDGERRRRRPRMSRRSASPTSARPRSSGTARPASRSTMRSSGRIAARMTPARRCARAGHEKLVSERTGLLLDPYFSATKIAWLLDNVRGRARGRGSRQARLRHGRHAICSGTSPAARCTRPTPPMRRAPLLLDIRTGQWDDELLDLFRVPSALLPEVRDSRVRFRHDAAASARRAGAHPRHRGRSAGRDHRARLLQARHDEIDLRHRLLRAAQHRRHAGAVARAHAHHHRVSARRQAHLCAGRRDLHRGRRGAMAARRAQADRDRGRDRHDRGAADPADEVYWCRPSSGSARRGGMPRRAARSTG